MTEKIGVTYLKVYVAGVLNYHLALFYDDGAGYKRVIEAAPEHNEDLTFEQQAGEVLKEGWSLQNKNNGSPFGIIVGGDRPWNDDAPNFDSARPQEILVTSDQSLRSQWDTIVADANQKFAAGYEYRPLQQNSNTFVVTLLRDASIRLPTGQPVGMSLLPGFQNILKDPIGRQGELPDSLDATNFAFSNPDPNTTSIAVDDPINETVQWQGGQTKLTLDGETSIFEPDNDTSITGVDGHVALIGSSSDGTFDGEGSDVLMLGGPGNDTFVLGYGGTNWIDGGSGTNTAQYTRSNDPLSIALPNASDITSSGDPIIKVVDGAGGGIDTMVLVQQIKLGGGENTINFTGAPPKPRENKEITIDLGATNQEAGDTVDLSQYGSDVNLSTTESGDGKGSAIGLFKDSNFSEKSGYSFTDFNILIVGNGNDKIDLHTSDNPYLKELDVGNGNDKIRSDIVNLTINLGNGTDTIYTVGPGTVVNAGSGKDTFMVSDDELIAGTAGNPNDVIITQGGLVLHGFVGPINSDSPWITSIYNGISYGINTEGQLAIKDTLGNITYIAGYTGGPSVPLSQQTDGIFVGRGSLKSVRLMDLTRPAIEEDANVFKFANEIAFIRLGHPEYPGNDDPLVLDLTGRGVNLTGETSVSPMFDMNGTGFAVHTGWTQPGTGLLVLQDANGDVKNINQLIGGENNSGFAALAQFDSNHDGVIDTNDPIFAQLKVWQDANADGIADPGELETLDQAGIASINVASTAQTNLKIAANAVNATGTFTRSDGTTGAIDDVSFTIDPFHSRYLGDTSVSAQAAAMPNLKGYGTLTDLHVAMTIDPALADPAPDPDDLSDLATLIDITNANLPNLAQLDLTALRTAAMPIFNAWARAVMLPDANGVLHIVDPASGHQDVPVLLDTDTKGLTVVDDFAYRFTDTDGTYFKLASGNDIKDSHGNVIARPTFDDVMAQTPTKGQWVDFTAGQIGFMERYLGHPLPIDTTGSDSHALIDVMSSFITASYEAMTLEAVRLAMQGPLKPFFPTIAYDVTSDHFHATTDAQLAPMYEAIFNAAPPDAAGATAWLTAWKPIIDVVLGDFDRGEGKNVSYAYMFASMVPAYEATHLPLSIADAAVALGVPPGEVVYGGATLTGTDDTQLFYLSGGDQTVNDTHQAQNFVMGGNFGHDVINANQGAPQEQDVLRFPTIKSTDVTASRNGIDLTITVNATGQSVTLPGEFIGARPGFFGFGNLNPMRGAGEITFQDGVVWDMTDLAWAVAEHTQPVNDSLIGSGATDVLDGRLAHYLSGGDGGDVYLFGRGDGHVTIEAMRTDALALIPDYVKFGPGITMSDVTFSRDGASQDLQISINGTNDVLTILGQFAADYSILGPLWLDRIDSFTFADGSTENWEDVIRNFDAAAPTSGKAQIYGFSYPDTLDGGPGVHYISGGNEDKTYLFDFNHAYDIIENATTNILSSQNHTIVFGDDVTPQDVTFSRVGNSNDLLVSLTDGSTIYIKGEYNHGFSGVGGLALDLIQNFQFADGTVLTFDQILANLTAQQQADGNDLYATDYGGTLTLGPANQYFATGAGDTTFVFGHGSGHETASIPGGVGDKTVQFAADVSPSDVTWSRFGSDLIIKLNGSNSSLTILDEFGFTSFGNFTFADGTTLSRGDVYNIVHQGTAGSDFIDNTNIINTHLPHNPVDGGPGNDVLIGSGQGDIFQFNLGDGQDVIIDYGNAIDFGAAITPAITQVHQLGGSLVFTFTGSTDRVTVIDARDLSTVTFADGTTWAASDIAAHAIVGPTLSTLQNGHPATPTYGGGNYEVDYNFASGYAFTAPQNEGTPGVNITLRVSGIAPANVDLQEVRLPIIAGDFGVGILISAKNSTASGLLVDATRQSILPFDQIVFDDGTTWTRTQVQQMLLDQAATTTGNYQIYGFGGNDTITAGRADDVLSGGNGNDTYVYNRGDGFDRIVSNKQFDQGNVDTLLLPDIASNEVTIERVPANDLQNLVIYINSKNGSPQGQITIQDEFDYGDSRANAGVAQIQFSNGVVWTEQQIESMLLAQEEAQGPGAIIYGFQGSDTLTARAISSVLEGLRGADTYVWTAGDGPTFIADNGDNFPYNARITDTLDIHGIDPSAVTVTRSPQPFSHDLILTMPGQNPIVLEGQAAGGSNSVIGKVVFDNGTTWNDSDLLIAADGGAATVPNGTTARAFEGTPATTTLTGTSSDDVYFWGAGKGNDTIAEIGGDPWAKADVLRLVGLNPSDVHFQIVQDSPPDLRITDKATGETLTVQAQFYGASHDGSDSSPGFGYGIEKVIFADGTEWTAEQILQNSHYVAAPGNTTVYNYNFGDGTLPIDASPGVTLLQGIGGNSDTYVWSPGDGSDAILDWAGGQGEVNTLREVGVNPADVRLNNSNNGLVITNVDTGEVTTVDFDNPASTSGPGIDQIVFDDDTVWNRSYIKTNLGIVRETPGSNTLVGTAFDDTLIAGSGNDTLLAGSGNDTLIAGSGNDTLLGDFGNDTLIAGSGNDTLLGGFGSDTYIYATADGNDLLQDVGSSADTDTLRLSDVNSSGVSLSRPDGSNDLLVTIKATGKVITVKDHFAGASTGIEQIQFADGTIWSRDQIQDHLPKPVLPGTPPFTVFGTNNNDTLTAAAGVDQYLSGSWGDDTYVYSKATGGDDVIEDQTSSGNDKLIFTDVNAGDITVERIGTGFDVILSIAGGRSITLRNELSTTNGVETIQFADGSTWTADHIKQILLDHASAAPFGNIYGFDDRNDTLVAGAGYKYMWGSWNDDTYVYSKATGGDDVIEDGTWSGNDRLVFTDVNPGDVTAERIGTSYDVILSIAGGKSVTIRNQLSTTNGMETIQFADGSTWTADHIKQMLLDQASAAPFGNIYGFDDRNDTLVAGAGDKYMWGWWGDDTYIYSKATGGDDVIDEQAFSGNDKLILTDVNPGNVSLERIGTSSDAILSIAGGKSITIRSQLEGADGVETVQFADGSTWTADQIKQKLLDQASAAPFGSIYGYDDRNDTLVAGPGDKYMSGSWGDDTYIYSKATGGDDVIDEQAFSGNDKLILTDVNPSDVTPFAVYNGSDVILSIAGGKSITLKNQLAGNDGMENIQFADGSTWTAAQLQQRVANQPSSTTLLGTSGNDTLVAGSGDMYLSGGWGNDTYIYAKANGGDDVVDPNGVGTDTLILSDINPGDVTLARVGTGNDLILSIAGGRSITIRNEFNNSIATIRFADSTVWTMDQIEQKLLDQQSAASSSSIYGFGNRNDTLVAGAGNEYLSGNWGNDTYIYSKATGGDDIVDVQGPGNDRLILTDINPGDVTLARIGTSNDVILSIAGGKSVTLRNEFSGWGISTIQFADGSTWSVDMLEQKLLDAASAQNSGYVYGFGNRNDTLVAGSGNKYLSGNWGNDTYIYSKATGGDDIIDVQGPGNDKLILTDINPGDVTPSRVNTSNDVILSIAGGKSITLKNEFGWGIGTIQFADGSTWSTDMLAQKVLDAASAQSSGYIWGFGNRNDTLVAGPGDKYLSGNWGDDTYIYSKATGGDDIVDVQGPGNDKLILTDINPGDVTPSRVNNSSDAILSIAGGKSITLKNEFGWGIRTIQFADGSTWSIDTLQEKLLDLATAQTSGYIYGFNGRDDTLVAGGGDKTLLGYDGNDTYVYTKAGGNDTIDDESWSGNDTLILSDINPIDVTPSRPANTNDAVLTIAGGNSITLKNEFNSFGSIETVQFADGTVWTPATITTLIASGWPPTISVTVSGTAQEGHALSASAVASDTDATVTYQWQSFNGTAWSNIAGATGATYAVTEADEGKQLRVLATSKDADDPGVTATSAATAVVIDIAPTLSVTVGGTAQEGQTLTANAIANDADAVVTYQWQSSRDGTTWSNIAGATGSTYTAVEADEGNQLRVFTISSDSDGSGTTATSTATAAVADITPTLSVTVSGTAQEGRTLTATAVANDADAVVTYQWQSFNGTAWSNLAGATNATYTPVEADEGNQLRVVATSSDPDGGGTTATSAATATVVDIAPTLAVTISGTAQEGRTLTATAVANDADAVVTYQWQSSRDSVTWSNIAGATSSTYTATEADEGSQLRVVATSSDPDGGGTTASAATTVVVDIAPTLSVTISGTAQEGQTLTATAVANDADAVVSYQWQSLSGSTWSNISGATGSTYVATAADDGHQLHVVATSSDSDGSGTTATSAATPVIAPMLSVTVSGTAQEGQTLTATVAGNGVGAVVTYQWQSFNGTAWSDIAGATNSTYAAAEADEGNQLRVVATSTSGGSGTTVTSAATSAVVDIAPSLSVTINGTAQEGQTLTAAAVANDADAVVTYEWQSFNGTSWSSVAGATASTYAVTEADEGNQLRVIVTSTDTDGGGTTATSTATATVADITPTLSVTVSGTAQEGQTLTASATPNDSDAVVSYQWQSLSGSTWSNISGAIGSTYTATEADEGHQLRVVATSSDSDGSGTTANSAATAAVSDITPTLSVTVSGTAQEGQALTASAVANDSDAVITYQWQSLAGSTWSNISGATGATYTAAESDEGHQLRVIATSTDADGSGTTATSTATAAVVDIAPTLSVSINGTAQEGQTLTAAAVANDADAVVTYQWQSLSGSTWSNISGATSATYVATEGDEGHQLRAIATSTDSDGGGTTTTSAATAAVVDITPTLSVSISGTAQEGQTLTASATANDSDAVVSYQWQSLSGSTWSNISGATGSTYTATEADEGHQLRVVATSTDSDGGGTTTNIAATAAVTDITPTLSVSVSGTAQEGQTLTASAVANDSDAVVTYQWQSLTGSTWSNISGATGSTYTATEADEGHQLRVVATSTDSDGSGSTANSAATAAVGDIAPTLSVSINGTAQEGQTLTAAAVANDADAVVTYQWQSLSGSTWSNISGATASTYTATEADEGHQLRVIATSTDTDGGGTTATSAATAAVVDITPTLSVTVSGTAQEGQTLTASASANDSDAAVSYQWQSLSGSTWSNISGATSSSYAATEADEGHQLRVVATSTDSDGSGTTANSAATAAVIDIAPTLSVTISGTVHEGQMLTATAVANDADAVVSYQWQSLSGSTWSNISGATGSTYSIAGADEGHQLRVVATSSDSDGSGTTATSAATVVVINNPPTLSNVAANDQFTEAGAAVTLAASAAVADPDNLTLARATVAIAGGTFAGDGDVLAATTTGTAITASYNAATETLTLSGSDTLGHYQQVLDSVTFASTSQNPTNYGSKPTRTLTWVVDDGSASNNLSAPQTTTVSITALNSPPTLSSIAASDQFTEAGAAVTLAASAAVSDPDNLTLARATVAIAGGTFAADGDVLAATTTGTAITANYNSTTETLTLTGSDTLAHYQQVLDSVTFTSASQNPTNYGSNPTRILTWTLDDGGASNNLSAPQTTTVNVTAVNNSPALAGVPASASFTQGGAAATLAPNVTLSDPDNLKLAGATVRVAGGTFASDGDLLAATTTGTVITASYNSTTETLTLTGSDTLADYRQVLDSVTFLSTAQDPSNSGSNPNRVVTWVVNDGSTSNNLSAAQTETIAIAIHNPTLSNVAASLQFTENTAPVILSGTVTVTDAKSANLANATVAITGGTFAGDGDVLAATTTSTSITASYNSTTETLILSGSDTLAHYQKVLRTVTFNATGDNPDNYGSSPTRTVTWTLNDGGASNNLSLPQTETVGITALNDPPTLTGVTATKAFTEAGAAVTLSPSVTVADLDNLKLANATVRITGGTFTGDGDLLSANTAGTSITASYNTTSETLTLTGSDTLADYRQVLDSVTFTSTSNNPTNYGSNPTRTLTWVLNDGSASSNTSTTQTETVSITAINNAPTLSNVAASGQFTAGHGAVTVSGAVTVTDPDNLNLVSAKVVVATGTFAGDGDVLAAATTGTSITASYNSTTETLTLSGSDTLAHYQSVLRSVTFNSTSANPTNTGAAPTRVLTWLLNDGSASNNLSTSATTTIAIPPIVTISNPSITVAAGSSIALPVTVSPSGSAVTVNITGLASYETITDHSDTTVFSGNSVTLTAAEVNSGLLLNSTYTGTGHPVNTLTVTANDTANGQTSSSAPQTITVTDPPLTTTSSTDVVSTDPSASDPSGPTARTSMPDVDPNQVAVNDPAPVLWQSHDTGPITVLAGTAFETQITWNAGSDSFSLGNITNRIALPSGDMCAAFNPTGFGARLFTAGASASPSSVLWTAIDQASPIARVGAASPSPDMLPFSRMAGAGVADGGLMPGSWMTAQQHLVFGVT